jgi:hypothetical protein
MDEAAAKEAAEEAAEEATAKEATDKKVEVGAAEGPSSSGQTPSLAVGAKREATPSGSTPPAKRPYKGVWKPRFVNFLYFPSFTLWQGSFFTIVLLFCAAHHPLTHHRHPGRQD